MTQTAARRLLRPRATALGTLFALIGTIVIVAPHAAQAALSQLGPIDSTGFPTWVDDGAGTRLQMCVDTSPLCFTARPDQATPPSATNLPTDGEAFYYDAEADIDRGGPLTFMRLAFEGTYAGGQPGTPATGRALFGRVRFRVFGLIPGASYKVTYPYGVVNLTADGTGRINTTTDIGCLPGASCVTAADFNSALASGVGQFLRWDPAVAPAPPSGYIGAFGTLHTVVGSPNNTNFFRIDGPSIGGAGVNTVQTNLFDIQGKLTDTVPSAPVAVTAFNALGESVKSTPASATTFTRPTPPTSVTIAIGPAVGELSVAWNPPTGNGGSPLTGYRVLRGSASGALTAITPDLPATANSFVDTGLAEGVTRFYQVASVNAVGAGTPSPELRATTLARPSVPNTPAITAGPDVGELSLSWATPASDGGRPITGYRIYRGDAAGTQQVLTDVAASVRAWSDTGLPNGATRFYTVTAINAVGESQPSSSVSATTFDVPSAPQDVTAHSETGIDLASVHWKAPASNGGQPVTEYRVYRAGSDNVYSLRATVGASTFDYTDSGLALTTPYRYRVSAVNTVGEGPQSGIACTRSYPGALILGAC
jgi:hypothetical protein